MIGNVIDVSTALSVASFLFTAYFWLVQARRERPHLEFYHLSDFRVSSRRLPEHPGLKRICIQQLDTGGVLVANHSIRQNSIVLFECFLETTAGDLPGDWGFTGDDKPPWNVGPESTIAISPACFFNVPEQLNVPENPRFRIEFLTATGKRFSHVFSRQAPRQSNSAEPARRAA